MPTGGDQLLDAIYEQPDDLAARRVYADWLQERGDPRGEFMMLQLWTPRTPAQEARERELLDAYGEKWQGRLSEITTWAEWSNGFLARCGLASIPAWAVGRREWATVTHVGISENYNVDIGSLIADPAMRSLESVRLASHALSDLLRTKHPIRARRMIVDGSVDSTVWATLVTAKPFAALRVLDVHGRLADPTSIFEAPSFDRVSFTNAGWTVTCKRGGDDRLSSVAIHAAKHREQPPRPETLVSFFKSLPFDVLSSLELPANIGGFEIQSALTSQPRLATGI